MSSTGLEERAAGVAVLLSPLGLRQSGPFEPTGLTADLSWPATLALAELLSASRKEGALTRDEADALLRAGGYDLAKFETQGWLRWVLGRFEIPMGVGIAIAGLEAGRSPTRVSATELRAVAPLRKRIHAFADAQPIIDKAAAEAILSAYRAAPTLEKLASEGAVRVNGEEVTLETRATLWSSRGDRIAATLWTKGPDANDLPRWIQRVPRDWWIAASVHLTEEQRGRLLDAMLAMVEDEPDLKDWPDEVSHIAPDVGDLGRELRRIDPPRASQLARYTWWKHLKIDGGRCRGRLACLVASIVRNDTERGVNPYRRIRKLLSLTPRKAWLALVVPQGLLHSRPEVLASLAADPQDAVLAMSLLDSLSVPEGSWDSADERAQRQERYR